MKKKGGSNSPGPPDMVKVWSDLVGTLKDLHEQHGELKKQMDEVGTNVHALVDKERDAADVVFLKLVNNGANSSHSSASVPPALIRSSPLSSTPEASEDEAGRAQRRHPAVPPIPSFREVASSRSDLSRSSSVSGIADTESAVPNGVRDSTVTPPPVTTTTTSPPPKLKTTPRLGTPRNVTPRGTPRTGTPRGVGTPRTPRGGVKSPRGKSPPSPGRRERVGVLGVISPEVVTSTISDLKTGISQLLSNSDNMKKQMRELKEAYKQRKEAAAQNKPQPPTYSISTSPMHHWDQSTQDALGSVSSLNIILDPTDINQLVHSSARVSPIHQGNCSYRSHSSPPVVCRTPNSSSGSPPAPGRSAPPSSKQQGSPPTTTDSSPTYSVDSSVHTTGSLPTANTATASEAGTHPRPPSSLALHESEEMWRNLQLDVEREIMAADTHIHETMFNNQQERITELEAERVHLCMQLAETTTEREHFAEQCMNCVKQLHDTLAQVTRERQYLLQTTSEHQRDTFLHHLKEDGQQSPVNVTPTITTALHLYAVAGSMVGGGSVANSMPPPSSDGSITPKTTRTDYTNTTTFEAPLSPPANLYLYNIPTHTPTSACAAAAAMMFPPTLPQLQHPALRHSPPPPLVAPLNNSFLTKVMQHCSDLTKDLIEFRRGRSASPSKDSGIRSASDSSHHRSRNSISFHDKHELTRYQQENQRLRDKVEQLNAQCEAFCSALAEQQRLCGTLRTQIAEKKDYLSPTLLDVSVECNSVGAGESTDRSHAITNRSNASTMCTDSASVCSSCCSAAALSQLVHLQRKEELLRMLIFEEERSVWSTFFHELEGAKRAMRARNIQVTPSSANASTNTPTLHDAVRWVDADATNLQHDNVTEDTTTCAQHEQELPAASHSQKSVTASEEASASQPDLSARSTSTATTNSSECTVMSGSTASSLPAFNTYSYNVSSGKIARTGSALVPPLKLPQHVSDRPHPPTPSNAVSPLPNNTPVGDPNGRHTPDTDEDADYGFPPPQTQTPRGGEDKHTTTYGYVQKQPQQQPQQQLQQQQQEQQQPQQEELEVEVDCSSEGTIQIHRAPTCLESTPTYSSIVSSIIPAATSVSAEDSSTTGSLTPIPQSRRAVPTPTRRDARTAHTPSPTKSFDSDRETCKSPMVGTTQSYPHVRTPSPHLATKEENPDTSDNASSSTRQEDNPSPQYTQSEYSAQGPVSSVEETLTDFSCRTQQESIAKESVHTMMDHNTEYTDDDSSCATTRSAYHQVVVHSNSTHYSATSSNAGSSARGSARSTTERPNITMSVKDRNSGEWRKMQQLVAPVVDLPNLPIAQTNNIQNEQPTADLYHPIIASCDTPRISYHKKSAPPEYKLPTTPINTHAQDESAAPLTPEAKVDRSSPEYNFGCDDFDPTASTVITSPTTPNVISRSPAVSHLGMMDDQDDVVQDGEDSGGDNSSAPSPSNVVPIPTPSPITCRSVSPGVTHRSPTLRLSPQQPPSLAHHSSPTTNSSILNNSSIHLTPTTSSSPLTRTSGEHMAGINNNCVSIRRFAHTDDDNQLNNSETDSFLTSATNETEEDLPDPLLPPPPCSSTIVLPSSSPIAVSLAPFCTPIQSRGPSIVPLSNSPVMNSQPEATMWSTPSGITPTQPGSVEFYPTDTVTLACCNLLDDDEEEPDDAIDVPAVLTPKLAGSTTDKICDKSLPHGVRIRALEEELDAVKVQSQQWASAVQTREVQIHALHTELLVTGTNGNGYNQSPILSRLGGAPIPTSPPSTTMQTPLFSSNISPKHTNINTLMSPSSASSASTESTMSPPVESLQRFSHAAHPHQLKQLSGGKPFYCDECDTFYGPRAARFESLHCQYMMCTTCFEKSVEDLHNISTVWGRNPCGHVAKRNYQCKSGKNNVGVKCGYCDARVS